MDTTANEPTIFPAPVSADSSIPTPIPTPANGAGAASAIPDASLLEKIERASIGAVEQHLATTKRGRGQRGPDKRPRTRRPTNATNGFPLGEMGESSGDPLLAEGTPAPLEAFVADVAPFDEALAGEVIALGIGLMNDGAAAIVRAVAKNETGNKDFADEAAREVQMSEKIEGAFQRGGLLCAKKYSVNLAYAPEAIVLMALGCWVKQIRGSIVAIKAKGAELRGEKR